MKLIKAHIPVHPKLDVLEYIIMEKDWFNEKIKLKDGTKIPNKKYHELITDENSLLNPNSPNCILNVEETYIVWGLKELFDYIRRLGTANENYYIGDDRFFYNSAYWAKYVYCGKAKFYFINPNDDIRLDERVEHVFDGSLDDIPQMKNYKFIDLTMVDQYFDYYGKLIDGGYAVRLGFDFETNGFPLYEGFAITGFALATEQLTTWFDYRYPLDASEEVRNHAMESLKKFVEKYQRRLWAYNVQFEMTVLYHLYQKKYELQDSRAILVTDGFNWGSLKVNAMKFLGIRGWTEGEAAFRTCSQKMFNTFKNYDEFDAWRQGQLPDFKLPKDFDKAYQLLVDNNPDWELFRKYWGYQWSVVPTRLLGYYCCLDSFYTVKLADMLYPKYKIAYPTYINNARLGFELGLSGIRINKEVLEETEKKMHELCNSARIFLDQFYFQNLIWMYEKKSKDIDLSENFKLAVQRYGMGVFDAQLARRLVTVFSVEGNVVYDEQKCIDYFVGNLELVEKTKKYLEPISGKMTCVKAFRQRLLMQGLAEILEEFYGIKKQTYEYNKKWNLTPDFFQVRDYLNSYDEVTSEAVFGDDRRYINWDKYKELYEKCTKAEIVDRDLISQCREIMLCDNNIDAKRVIDALRNNREKVDFFNRVKIPEPTSWDYEVNFFNRIAGALRTDKSALEELNQIFVNFSDVVQVLHNKYELSKYDEMEEINVLDRPEYVTYGGQKVKLQGLGGKVNYKSPDIKRLFGDFVYMHYDDELKYISIRNGKWLKAEGLPKPDKPEWIRTNDEGVEEYFLKPTLDEHIELRKTNKSYREQSDPWQFHANIKGLATVILPMLYGLGGYDPKDQKLTLKTYPKKYQQLIMLSHFYTYQNGVTKELTGYITGRQQGIRTRMGGVSRKLGLAEVHASKAEDIKYWSYYPSWCINEKATKRWSSGYRIAT